MTVSFRRKVRTRSMAAGLALTLLFAAGCPPEEEAADSPPRSPLPTADSGRPVQPRPPRTDQGGETKDIGEVGRDLHKDLASSPIRPVGPTTYFPPAGRPDSTRADDATGPRQP
jgi:hypothetical protein